ncbi:MAG: xanthine dehydrogenase family protein molybdopterin-binding subunit [Myxococcota bacterium]|jgi:CO/xanthine dehydrogenase Mo-binding subunit|nr:xanthine dehydrogenase family protein molybdopterin-binding subunit [Myxococcota bacterium]
MERLNEPAFRNDAVAKVTGRAKYTADLKVQGMVHATVVHADFVSARIQGIETAAASKSKGVLRVVTAADVPGERCFGQIEKDLPVLAELEIHSHGDVVAIVVALTKRQALQAATKVRIEAEPTEPILDPQAALAEGATRVHAHKPSNLVCHHKIRRGDAPAALRQCEVVVAESFSTSRIEHAYLEPEAALAIPRPDGVMEIRGSMQHPFSTRRFVAAVLAVPLSEVEVVGTSMGGGFGGKDDTAAMVCARAALCARLVGRPVKLVYSREQSLRESYKRHPYQMSYELGLRRDGTIEAAAVHMVADAGAYCSVTPWVTWRSTVQCCGPYRVPHVHCDVLGVHTNNVFTGAMRGFGSPQVNFAVEQLVEIAAERLGLDAVEFRRKNLLQQGDETVTGQKLDGHTVALEQVLERAIAESDYQKKLQRCSFGKGARQYGIGLALSYRGMSLGAEGTDFASAIINVQADGSVLLETGVHENGQGSESAMVLVLAKELGLSPRQIRYRLSSTSAIPDSGTTVASRGTLMGGGAVVEAARTLRTLMSKVVSASLNCDPNEVVLRDGRWWHGPRSLSFAQAAALCFAQQVHPHATGTFRAPQVSWDEETGQGNAYFTWVYGCQVAELEVDEKSGRIRLLSATAVHDVGRAVNPHMLLGQAYGGMAMAIGYALHEKVEIEDGRVKSLNFDTYRIPRAADIPPLRAVFVENPDPLSPSLAKGIGEPTNELLAPAIGNALYRATGERRLVQPLAQGGLR